MRNLTIHILGFTQNDRIVRTSEASGEKVLPKMLGYEIHREEISWSLYVWTGV
jgi:hypothetical protein